MGVMCFALVTNAPAFSQGQLKAMLGEAVGNSEWMILACHPSEKKLTLQRTTGLTSAPVVQALEGGEGVKLRAVFTAGWINSSSYGVLELMKVEGCGGVFSFRKDEQKR